LSAMPLAMDWRNMACACFMPSGLIGDRGVNQSDAANGSAAEPAAREPIAKKSTVHGSIVPTSVARQGSDSASQNQNGNRRRAK
jgi:hypothetical protein